MSDQQNLFEEFTPISREEWLAKVERDLKGKPLTSLHWQLDDDITLEPFYHPDDVERVLPPITDGRDINDWETGEYITVDDLKIANHELLEGLNGGVDAPQFRFHHPLRPGDLDQLLQGINLEMISVHFGQYFVDKDPVHLFQQLQAHFEARQTPLEKVRGSLDFDPILDWNDPPFEQLAEMIQVCSEKMPQFRCLQVNARRFHSGSERTALELGYAIAKGSEYLAQLTARGLTAATINQHLQFSIDIGTIYFVEIAKIRALKQLWLNVMKGFGVAQPVLPTIIANLASESQTEDPNTNMIRAATQAMSAVIGGVDILYVPSSNAATEDHSTSFSRRIARNVQHILRLESSMDRVIDPAAGSYYVEKLTAMLSEKAWSKFQEIEEKGGYMEI